MHEQYFEPPKKNRDLRRYLMNEHIIEVKSLLSSPKKILITTHQRPDGDAIGSSLALFHFLKKKSHEVNLITPTDYPDFLKWMPGDEHVVIFEDKKDESKKIVDAAEIIFCLDFNKLNRIDDLGKLIQNSSAPKILIDHHLEADEFARYSFLNVKATSTSELVYDFILQLDEKNLIDASIATCLYAGILTDTDRFRIPTTSAHVHRIVADLIELGVDYTNIYQQIYETFSENRLRFVGYCLREKLEVFNDLKSGIIALEKDDMNRFHCQLGDTENLVNYALWIKGLKVSALIIQRPNEVKISMRSKGDFSVEQICREYFNGGGHRNASGGFAKESVKQTREKLISILARFKKELHQ